MTLNISDTANHTPSPQGAHDAAVTFAFGTTSLGQALVAATEKGICAILLGSNRDRLAADLRQHFPEAQPAEDDRLADAVVHAAALIEDPRKPVDLALDLQGSEFEIKVWQALRVIPAGESLSYSELAQRLGVTGGEKGPAKEVADACAGNKIAVAVPCHRIRRKDGTISGYRWGVHRKRVLLERESIR